MAIQELGRPNHADIAWFQLNNYDFIYNTLSGSQTTKNGVAFIIHPLIKQFIKPITLTQNDGLAIGVQINLPNIHPIIVINVYCPPDSISRKIIQELIANLLPNNEVIICGDMNIDFENNVQTHKWTWLSSILNDQTLVDVGKFTNNIAPTHFWKNAHPSRLDFFMATPKCLTLFKNSALKVHQKLTWSDHVPIEWLVKLDKLLEPRCVHKYLKPKKLNKDQTQKFLDLIKPFNNYLGSLNLDDLDPNQIFRLLDQLFQLISISMRTVLNQHEHFITSNYKQWDKQFVNISNSINVKVRQNKSVADTLNKFTKHKPIAPTRLMNNGSLLSEDETIKYILDQIFVSNRTIPTPQYLKNIRNDTKGKVQVLMQDIEEILSNASPKTAVGPDGVSLYLLSLTPFACKKLLHKSIETSFDTIFPKKWNTSILNLIPKSNSISGPSDFRPLTNIHTCNKIRSHLLLKQLTKFCDDNNILDNFQFGFRKNYSHLDSIINFAARNMDSEVSNYSIDLRKAYDMVNLPILFKILHFYKVPNNIVMAIRDNYNNNTIKTNYGGKYGPSINPSEGLRQGCPLSPLLFNIYISLTIKSLNSGKPFPSIISYADDLMLMDKDQNALEKNFVVLKNSLKEIGLEINLSKSKKIRINKPNECYPSEIRYLGTYFSTENTSTTCLKNAIKTIDDFLISIAPLNLWKSTIISLFNSILCTRIANVMTNPFITLDTFECLGKQYKTKICGKLKLPPWTSPKAVFSKPNKGGLGVINPSYMAISFICNSFIKCTINKSLKMSLSNIVYVNNLLSILPNGNYFGITNIDQINWPVLIEQGVEPVPNEYISHMERSFCDGSFDETKGSATSFAHITGPIAKWFSYTLPKISAFYSELWGLILLLKYHWDHGYYNPVCFLDCSAVITIATKMISANQLSPFTTFMIEKQLLYILVKTLKPTILKIKGHNNDFGNELVNLKAQSTMKKCLNWSQKITLYGKLPKTLSLYYLQNNPLIDKSKSFWFVKPFNYIKFKWANCLYSSKVFPPVLWAPKNLTCQKCNSVHNLSLPHSLLYCNFWSKELSEILKVRKISPLDHNWITLSETEKILILRGFHTLNFYPSPTSKDSEKNWTQVIKIILSKANMFDFELKRPLDNSNNSNTKRYRSS